jgi:hypothetical protein
MAQPWLKERWETLFSALDGLGIEQEEQIAAICEQ